MQIYFNFFSLADAGSGIILKNIVQVTQEVEEMPPSVSIYSLK